jgi:hypothetical protein
MRPYRTFTKNNRGAICLIRMNNGRITAHLTSCSNGTSGKVLYGPMYGISFLKGSSGKNRAEALNNLDTRLVQVARSVLSKTTDAQLQAYLLRLGFTTVFRQGRRYDGLYYQSFFNVVKGDGLKKARFYARRILRAHEVNQVKKAA